MNFEMKGTGFSIPTGGSGRSASETNEISTVFQQTTRCPICLMKYKNPRRLYCNHSFCRNCLQGEIERQKQNFSCVVCQEPISLPKNGVDQLDGMLIIHDIVEFYHGKNPQPKIQCSKCEGSYCSSCLNLVCHKCDKYISTEFCTDCFEGFCSRCAEEHELTTGDHILVDVDQAHDIVKDTSEDGEGEDIDQTGMDTKEKKDEQNGNEAAVEGKRENDEEDSSESELDFVYEVSGGVNDGGSTQQGSSSGIAEMHLNEDKEEEDKEDGGLQLISHHTVSIEAPVEVLEDYSDTGQVEVAEDYSDTDSASTDQSGFNVVFKVNDSDGSDGSVAAASGGGSSLPSPSSSQSGVAMTYEVNQEEPNVEDQNNHTPEDHTPEEHGPVVNVRQKRVRISEIEQVAPDPSVHHYDELQELVNARVNVHITPEEAKKLVPSAPRSEKRRRVARIRPDMTHEPRLPKSYYEIQSLKWCSRITIGFIIVLTLCTLAFAGLSLTAYLLSSQDTSAHVFQNYSVVIDRPQPFWVRSTSVATSGAYDSSYHYESQIYLIKCSDLVEQEVNYVVNASGTQNEKQVDITVEVPTAPNGRSAYFAPGSKMAFSVLVWSDYTHRSCSSELSIYDNYDEFISDEGLRAVHSQCIDIQRSSTSTPTTFTYTVEEANFYFATLLVPSEDSYSVNITVEGQNYEAVQENYISKCTITSMESGLEDGCDFNELVSSSIVWDLNHCCMVAETRPLASSSSDDTSFVRFSISYSPNIFRNFAYIAIVLPLPVYFIMCLLVWLCFKGCNAVYVKCRNMHYTHEYQVTEI